MTNSLTHIDTIPTRCNSKQSALFYCKITLHVSGVTAPIIGSLQTVTVASGTGHNIGTAISLQPFRAGQVVAVPIL